MISKQLGVSYLQQIVCIDVNLVLVWFAVCNKLFVLSVMMMMIVTTQPATMGLMLVWFAICNKLFVLMLVWVAAIRGLTGHSYHTVLHTEIRLTTLQQKAIFDDDSWLTMQLAAKISYLVNLLPRTVRLFLNRCIHTCCIFPNFD